MKEGRRMLTILERIIGKRRLSAERERSAYGSAASMLGVMSNALLFALKLAAGAVSGSVAITADAANNLSDASSSVISLLGFKLADKPADEEHPYGHGRYEYLSGLIVAVMIMVIGVELMKSSVEKILSPTPVIFSGWTAGTLALAIAVKLWQTHFNRAVGRKIHSMTLMATADDSRNDAITTGAVLCSMALGHVTGLALDGLMGTAVAAFILVSGARLIRDTISPMLGSIPSKERIAAIRQRLMGYPGVLGIHDLMVHDYGPGRQYASVHLEMDAQADVLESHDLIDNIEREFLRDEGLHLVIHYDPVVTDDPHVAELRELTAALAAQIDPRMTIHDLRIVPGLTHVNVVFDCVVPFGLKTGNGEIRERISRGVAAEYPDHYCVMTLENSYVHMMES